MKEALEEALEKRTAEVTAEVAKSTQRNVVLKALKRGFSVNEVSELVELSMEEIKELESQLLFVV